MDREPRALSAAIGDALAECVQTRPQDAAVVELARQYAAAIDAAAEIADDLAEIEHQVDPADVDIRQWLGALQAKVDAHAVLGELGPRLLAALVELGMTPKARAAFVKGGPAGATGKRSRLDELREQHAARVDGTAAVDAPAS